MYFEKQQGQLCAQHALNSLLQGPYFTPMDLAEIAATLDKVESETCSQLAMENMDDSGYFSVQVISKALEIWNLELIHVDSSRVKGVKLEEEEAFICNYENHWFSLRNFSHSLRSQADHGWYNFDSTLDAPRKISDTYLVMYLLELKNSGYTIFMIRGKLPIPQTLDFVSKEPQGDFDEDLEIAIAHSLSYFE